MELLILMLLCLCCSALPGPLQIVKNGMTYATGDTPLAQEHKGLVKDFENNSGLAAAIRDEGDAQVTVEERRGCKKTTWTTNLGIDVNDFNYSFELIVNSIWRFNKKKTCYVYQGMSTMRFAQLDITLGGNDCSNGIVQVFRLSSTLIGWTVIPGSEETIAVSVKIKGPTVDPSKCPSGECHLPSAYCEDPKE